jgi:hypothetical protein
MYRFFKTTTIYIVIGISTILILEILLQNANGTFPNKARYFKNNRENIEIIILGSSHNQNAINPGIFPEKNTANLAYGHQDLNLDLKLLKKAINECPNLKLVIAELSYHTLEFINKDDYWRNNLYLRFYNISPKNSFSLYPWNYSILFSNLFFYRNYYLRERGNLEKYKINEFGFIQNDFYGRFLSYNYDSAKIEKNDIKVQTKFNYRNFKALRKNKKIVKEIIRISRKNNLEIIFVSPPVYATAYSNYLDDKKMARTKFLEEINKEFEEVTFLNYEESDTFHIKDFKNDDHLNTRGANKFTEILIQDLSERNLIN